MAKKEKRKFFGAADLGSGFLRAFDGPKGLERGPKIDDPTLKKFHDPDLSQHGYYVDENCFWILVEPMNDDIAVLSHSLVLLMQSRTFVYITEKFLLQILTNGLGTISVPTTIQYPDTDSILSHDAQGRSRYTRIDKGVITKKCHVISGVTTKVANQGGNYRLNVA